MSEDLQQLILNSDVIYGLMRALPNPELIVDENINDSDKTLTVDTDEIWEILSIWVELSTTSTVGNRRLQINFRDASDDVIADFHHGINHSASLTRYYHYFPGASRDTSFFNTVFLHWPIPRIYLPSGFDIRIYDGESVDAASDDLIVQMMINRFDVP